MTIGVVLVAVATVGGGPRLMAVGGDPAPGLLVNRSAGARPFDPPDPSRPTFVFAHGFNPLPGRLHFTMAARLGEAVGRRYGPGAYNVLDWDWNAATIGGLRSRDQIAAAIAQGPALAEAIRLAGIDPARLHLIGHSAGAGVVASAARTIAARTGVPVAQLTLLESAWCFHEDIFVKLAACSASARVENYWVPGPSGYGRAVTHPGVTNVRIDGRTPWFGVVWPTRSGHFDIVRWYLATAESPASRDGFNTSILLGP